MNKLGGYFLAACLVLYAASSMMQAEGTSLEEQEDAVLAVLEELEKRSESDAVVDLTDSNFEKLVLESEDMWMVNFYTPWCGHCKQLAPVWEKAAAELKGKVKVGKVDALVNRGLSDRFEVMGFPTILVFWHGKKDGSPHQYVEGRTSSDIVNWALESRAKKITSRELKQEDALQAILDALE